MTDKFIIKIAIFGIKIASHNRNIIAFRLAIRKNKI